MEQRINLEFFHKLKQNTKELMEWCMKMGLIASKMKCSKCGCPMRLQQRKNSCDAYEWKCRVSGAGKHVKTNTIRTGSWFSDSKLGIADILILSYMWCHKLPSNFIAHELGLSSHTVIDWKYSCRAVCLDSFSAENVMIGGEGKIVQINGSKFTNKHNKKRNAGGEYVYAGIERDTDNYFMCVVNMESKEQLLNVIKKYVNPGTSIASDCWQIYDCLNDEEYLHVNDLYTFVNLEDTLQDSWTSIKKKLTSKHGQVEFDLHLAEYMWHRRYTNKIDEKFLRFLDAIKLVYTFNDED